MSRDAQDDFAEQTPRHLTPEEIMRPVLRARAARAEFYAAAFAAVGRRLWSRIAAAGRRVDMRPTTVRAAMVLVLAGTASAAASTADTLVPKIRPASARSESLDHGAARARPAEPTRDLAWGRD